MSISSKEPIRVDQSYTMRLIVKYLTSNKWSVVFSDFSHSSRGGYGDKGRVFELLESLMSPTPDIIATKNSEIHFVEVDGSAGAVSDSLSYYKDHSERILSEFSSLLRIKLDKLSCGFGRYGIIKDQATITKNARKEIGDVVVYTVDSNTDLQVASTF